MKRKFLFLVLAIAMMLTLCLAVNAMDGSGTESDPYLVKTAEDFLSINTNLSAHYKLMASIAVSANENAVIDASDNTPFSGTFDGNGYTIDVTVVGATSNTNTFDSLFSVVSGKIKNLTVTGSVSGSDKVSGIVGKLKDYGNVDGCINYATVSGRKNVGGIVGLLVGNATITNCVNFGSINGANSVNKGVDTGGIVGCVWESSSGVTTISNCYNAGVVNTSGDNNGGICGYFYGGSIENCFNTGKLISTSTSSVGEFYGKAERNRSYKINGYYCDTRNKVVGVDESNGITLSSYMIESTGVAIYLGNGSGIRGEFHMNKSVFEAFSSLVDRISSEIEYGTVVSTKAVLTQTNGSLISQEAIDSQKVVFAPAFKDGAIQYSYDDATKGAEYHSYRYALTNFPDTSKAYNTEFVILGYIMITNGNEKRVITLNTVLSDRLASEVGETGLNAVSIVRVAEATLNDGDFNGNTDALNSLNHIVSFKDFETKIDIDGVTGYGHLNATFTKSISSDDTVVFKISSTNATEFNKYVYDMTSNGYEKVSQNEINNNLFYTYKNGSTLINAVFFPSQNEVTVTRESATNLPSSLSAPTYVTKNTPSITQLKLEASIKEGMSYVIHLSDGTFFIIDGGWCDNDQKEADKLYNKLVALANGNDIVISGWLFTHCHGDHIGTFNLFVEKYHDSVTIKEILYNFPSDEDISNSASSYMIDNSKQRYTQFRYVISTYLTDTKYVKIHSGYKFYYADAEIEILQTLEDLYPSTVANYDFNNSSTLFTVKIAGQKMLFVGDVDDVGASRLNAMFGSTLKSDFVQIAHHGINSSSTIRNMYVNADAEYVFYPAPLDWYISQEGNSANFYISTESKTVKQIFISGVETFTLELPYAGTLYDGNKTPGYSPDVEDEEGTRTEVERPSESVALPDAYFDLDMSSGTPVDSKNNATVTVTGGSVVDATVTHDGKESTTSVFTGDRYKNAYYMTLNFNNIKSDAEWESFVMGSSTFEIMIRLDKIPTSTVGIFTSCNEGGTTIYIRRNGKQLNFQIGSTYPNENGLGGAGVGNYSAATSMDNDGPVIEAGDLVHIVGSYDKATNKMKLYINGILVSEADYGTGSFKGGKENDYVLGIGYNPQYGNEEISDHANYEVFEAKIYNSALSDEQVAQEYWNCIDEIMTEDNK